MSIRFASSQYKTMRPLSYQGITAIDCYEQLRALLRQNEEFLAQRGMPQASSFLAEPMSGSRGSIDWYVPGNEKPVRFVDLAPAQQAFIQGQLAQYSQAIKALIESENQDPLSTNLLRIAMQHPSPEDIWVINNRPLLINWGMHSSMQGAQPEDIMRAGAFVQAPRVVPEPSAPPPPPPPPVTTPPQPEEEQPRRLFVLPGCLGCLSWLLPLALLLLVLWLLLAFLGIMPSPLLSGCVPLKLHPEIARDSSQLQAEQQRKKDLASEQEQLLRQLQERAALCKPKEQPPVMPVPSPEPTPAQTPEPSLEPKDETPTLPFFGNQEAPEVPEAPATPFFGQGSPQEQPQQQAQAPESLPFFGATPQQQLPQVQPGAEMEIPQQAAKENNLTFLEGCWRSETDMYNVQTNQPVIVEYCFNKNGVGERFVHESGNICKGKATAKFDGDRLSIKAPKARCADGSNYVPQQVICDGSGSSTKCYGEELGEKRSRWEAQFKRK